MADKRPAGDSGLPDAKKLLAQQKASQIAAMKAKVEAHKARLAAQGKLPLSLANPTTTNFNPSISPSMGYRPGLSQPPHAYTPVVQPPTANAMPLGLAAIQARINSYKASQGIPITTPAAPEKQKPMGKNVRLNEKGELVDETGTVVQVTSRTPQLKANIRAKLGVDGVKNEEEEEEEDEYFDASISEKNNQTRMKTGLQFINPGRYQKAGERMRSEITRARLEKEIAESSKKTGISAQTKLALLTHQDHAVEVIPDVEWWDAIILPNARYLETEQQDNNAGTSNNDMDVDIIIDEKKYNKITDLIEHPELIDAPITEKKIPQPVYLTKKERIKIRRQRRREAELEKREQIRLGIFQPDDPKLKLSNFMRAKTDEGIMAPSQMEAIVRAQMESRQDAHKEHNESRMLTKEERSAKKTKKLTEDTSEQAHVCVFRLRHLKDYKNRYKVDTNAQQFKFTGLLASSPDCTLVVVEGGPKNIKKYKRLMLQRIKWAEEKLYLEENQDEEDAKSNYCVITWEGTVKKNAFKDWRMKIFTSSSAAREWFQRMHVEHYWDMGLQQSILHEEQ